MTPEDIIKQASVNGHSWFSPSAAKRLLNCPASLIASIGIPDTSSPVADRGTECHDYMEKAYNGEPTDQITFVEPWQYEAVNDAVLQVNDLLELLSAEGGIDLMRLEHVYSMAAYGYPSVFGTCDMTLWCEATRHLVILDYKFGMGEVDPKDNHQLMTYGVMALADFPAAERISLVICQPRTSKNIKRWEISASELAGWGNVQLIEGIKICLDTDRQWFRSGDHCRFCRYAKVGCEEQQRVFIQMSDQIEGAVVATGREQPDKSVALGADNSVMVRILQSLPFLEMCIKSFRAAAVERIHSGEQFRGFKPVNKIGNRKWIDEGKAEKYLARKKLSKKDRTVTKLISPAKAEKFLNFDNTQARNAFDALWEKPITGVDIAPLDDKRQAVAVAQTTEEEQQGSTQEMVDISSLL